MRQSHYIAAVFNNIQDIQVAQQALRIRLIFVVLIKQPPLLSPLFYSLLLYTQDSSIYSCNYNVPTPSAPPTVNGLFANDTNPHRAESATEANAFDRPIKGQRKTEGRHGPSHRAKRNNDHSDEPGTSQERAPGPTYNWPQERGRESAR